MVSIDISTSRRVRKAEGLVRDDQRHEPVPARPHNSEIAATSLCRERFAATTSATACSSRAKQRMPVIIFVRHRLAASRPFAEHFHFATRRSRGRAVMNVK